MYFLFTEILKNSSVDLFFFLKSLGHGSAPAFSWLQILTLAPIATSYALRISRRTAL
jgi:hypothetical protein